MPPVGFEPTTDWLLTTSAFAALAVRGLDFAFTRSGCSPSSLYTFAFLRLARRCQLRVHRIWRVIQWVFLLKASFESQLLLPTELRRLTGMIIPCPYVLSIPNVKNLGKDSPSQNKKRNSCNTKKNKFKHFSPFGSCQWNKDELDWNTSFQ